MTQLPDPPLRVLRVLCKWGPHSDSPLMWFQWDEQQYWTGDDGLSVTAGELTVIPHPQNDAAAVQMITKAKGE